MNTEWLTELGRNFKTLECRTDSYNIFQVLEIESKEVLICRFLGDLLIRMAVMVAKLNFSNVFSNCLKQKRFLTQN